MFFFQAASLAAVTSSAGGRVHCREKLPFDMRKIQDRFCCQSAHQAIGLLALTCVF